MRSSTSSSRGGGARARRQWTALAVGLLTAAAAGVAAHTLVDRALPGPEPDIVSTEAPAAADAYYLAYDRSGHVDHHVIFHGIDRESTANLRASDVLLLGNSRLMFAFTRQDLRGFFPRLGLTYYVLGFGHREHDAFPRAIIRRFDLRPKLVIVNADRFFLGDQSAWADRVMDDSWFDAAKLWFEAEATHAVRRTVQPWLPHVPSELDRERELIAYRSRADGTWLIANSFAGLGGRMAPDDGRPLTPDFNKLARARDFKAEVEARGGRLVLCLVPAPTASRAHAEWLAGELGVPLVAPVPDELRTFDGSHLTPQSASRFAGLFFAELEPVLREMGLVR
jgi:hypothetical protein